MLLAFLFAGAVLVLLVHSGCASVCEKNQSRCDGDTYEICNADRNGWALSPCHSADFAGSRCVTLDATTAVCRITGAVLATCAGERATACAEGAIVSCFRGHGAPYWKSCGNHACADGPAESACTEAIPDAGAGD